MAKKNTKIGDIFCVSVNNDFVKYFQYIGSDLTQLNSDVVRCFKKEYPIGSNPDIKEIINDEVDFYAHCVTKLGLKMGFWNLIGNSNNLGDIKNVLFKSSGDRGNLNIKISKNWWVWKINEDQKYVGELIGENRFAEIGSVIPPDSIVYRMQYGKYDFVYPAFE